MLPQKHLCGSALEVLLWQLAYLCGVPPSLRRFGGVRDQKKWSGGPQWAKVTAPAPLQGPSPCEPVVATWSGCVSTFRDYLGQLWALPRGILH